MKRTRRVLLYTAMGIAVAITLLPVYWMINIALTPQGEVLSYPPTWVPTHATLDNLSEVIVGSGGSGMARDGLKYAINSLIIATASTLLALIFGSFAAYGLARWKSKWSDRISMWILSTRMFPPAATVIPVYLAFVMVGLNDKQVGLIIAYVAYNLPFVTWMMRGFFRAIPTELEEAARVEGCSNVKAYFRVALPLVRPGLAVAGLFSFVFAWNEFLLAVVLTQMKSPTIPIQMASYQGVKGMIWGNIMAAAIVASIPGILLAFVAQKHLIKGLTLGAVKG